MKEQPQKTQNWNERYLTADTPWRHEMAHSKLLELVEKYTADSDKILEIGCGTGAEAIALAKLGYDVLAIDIAEKAIELARAQAKHEHSQAKFQVVDFMNNHPHLAKFATICDVACMHTFTTDQARIEFADHLAAHLNPEAIWINLSCAKPAIDKVAKKTGIDAPPGLTLTEIAMAAAQHFNLLEIHSTTIPVKREHHPLTEFPVWVSVFQKNS